MRVKTDQTLTTIADWRAIPYRLQFYGKNERMIASIDLTPDQAAVLGSVFCPTRTDGLGEYDIEADVQMGPK